MKKLMSILLAVTMLCSMTVTVFAADVQSKEYPQKFWDVPKDHWAFSYIAELVDRGVIAGYDDGSFKPDNTVTRAEWSKIMVLAAGLQVNDSNVYFTDMTNHWANTYVNAARDYLSAYSDGTFKPDQAAVREDVTVSMVKLKGYDVNSVDYSYLSQFTDTNSISNDLKKYVAVAVEKELISGFDDNTFRGQNTLTRAEAATLLWKAFQYGNDNKLADTPPTTVDTPSATQNTNVTPTPIPATPKPTATPEIMPEPTEESTPTPKPYKVDTLAKANVKNNNGGSQRDYFTFDGGKTIYYCDTNNVVHSVNTETGEDKEVLSPNNLIIDNDEMTLEDFEINNIFYDTNHNQLFVSGSYATVKTANNVNNSYLYSVTSSGTQVVTDEWPEGSVYGVTSNSECFHKEFIETDGYIYSWYTISPTEAWLVECDGNDISEYIFSSNSICAGFTNNSVITAINDTLTAYNFKGKELYKITADEYERVDNKKVNFGNAVSYLMITDNNSIVFYDISNSAFRIISSNV